MSALVRKEIRLLLPSFSIALLLAFSVWLVPQGTDSPSGFLVVFPFLFCPGLAVMMALDSFGREIGSGTFANLLSQPAARSHIWRTKTVLLAVAQLTVLGAWWLSVLGHTPFSVTIRDLDALAITSALIALTAFSGGLWTVLLFRQVAVAFWFTLLVPAGLSVLTSYLSEKLLVSAGAPLNIAIVLTVYSIAGFILARRMFLRAQDVQWTGGEIAMPHWLRWPRLFAVTQSHSRPSPRLALLAKEIQLHQSQFVIAGALLVLHLGMIVARKIGEGFRDSPTLEFLTGQFWVLWVVMPLLIGCAAVAEERKLGTLEVQLCLPARRRTQFVIKFFVVLVLSAIFGVVVPVLFEGQRIFPDIPFLPQLAIVTGVVAISFYASTLARNTLQSLAPAVLGILVASVLATNGSYPEVSLNYPLWRGWLVYMIGVPVFTFTLAWLTYWNFKHVLIGWPAWRRNSIVILASVLSIVTLTSAIYQRVWELVLPIEPAHDVARLTPLQGVTMRTDGVWNDSRSFMVRLPGGRIWADRFEIKGPSCGAMLFGDRRFFELSGGRFLDGTNWSSFAIVNRREIISTKSDGSLWVSEQPKKPVTLSQSGQLTRDPANLVRFGDDNNWKSVARENDTSATLLKRDGTLWRLGANRFNWKTPRPGLRAFEPQSLEVGADWADISSDGNQAYFRKANGEFWRFASRAGAVKNAIQLDEKTWLYRVSHFELFLSHGDVSAFSRRIGNFMVGVREDGTFRLSEQEIQIGKETNWIAAAGNGETVVTLKSDGSLWKWTFPDDPIANPNCVRLGTHSDWVAVAGVAGEIVSLAADGSLWSWQFEPFDYYRSSGFDALPIMRASRKPQKIGSIFTEAK